MYQLLAIVLVFEKLKVSFSDQMLLIQMVPTLALLVIPNL